MSGICLITLGSIVWLIAGYINERNLTILVFCCLVLSNYIRYTVYENIVQRNTETFFNQNEIRPPHLMLLNVLVFGLMTYGVMYGDRDFALALPLIIAGVIISYGINCLIVSVVDGKSKIAGIDRIKQFFVGFTNLTFIALLYFLGLRTGFPAQIFGLIFGFFNAAILFFSYTAR